MAVTSGRKTVATATTPERLVTDTTRAIYVVIVAETDNTGVIAVGDSGVLATLATRKGIPLSAGQSLTLLSTNLAEIWLDTTVNGDGVTWLFNN